MIPTNQAEGQSISCPNNIGDFYLTDSEVFSWGGGAFCGYEREQPYARSNIQIVWENADTGDISDEEYWCTGHKESVTEYRSVWSSTHYAYVWTPYAYDGFENAMQVILSDIESQNIPLRCDNDGSSNGDACPPDYPYLWSDGYCYDQPQCPPDYPYYNPETNKCSTTPCFDPQYPYYNSETNKCYTTSQSPDDWNELGNELLDQGKYDEALEAYDKAISLDSNYKWAWYNKALALRNLEKYEDALIALNQALRLDPNYKGAYFEKGFALGELGRFEESIKAYQKGLQLYPNDKHALLSTGWALNNLGRYEEAISYFDKALKIDPNYALAKDNKEYALEQLSKKQADQAEYDSWIQQGREHLNNGNFDEAIKYFDLAYKQNPSDQNLINLKAEALMEKGVALKHAGKYDLAVIYLGESNHLKPNENVKELQDDAYNRWYTEIKTNRIPFDPNAEEHWKLFDPRDYALFPTVGEVDADVITRAKIRSVGDDHFTSITEKMPLKVGDVILVGQASLALDWGGAKTILAPNSIFLIGDPEDLRSYARGNPHYIELIDGQIRIYDLFREVVGEKAIFLFKVRKNPIEVSGTDVTINYDKTTGVSSIQIDEGAVKVFDVSSNEIKEFGVGETLVTNNDGYYLLGAVAQPTGGTETPDGGGCLIATAAFGSEMAPQVQFLREIRDNAIMSTNSGASFMSAFNYFYYSFSPTIADLERQNPVFKEMVKVAITPLLSSLSLLQYVDIDSEEEMLGYGIGIILLNIGVYFIGPTFLIVGLKSKFSKIHA
jgi:tetratricopeptide (TPR) repeat protein